MLLRESTLRVRLLPAPLPEQPCRTYRPAATSPAPSPPPSSTRRAPDPLPFPPARPPARPSAAPHVVIWSAVACSAALSGLFAPQELLARNAGGELVK